MSVTSATRPAVLKLYRKIIKLGNNWNAKDPSKTAAEREEILTEARVKFRANKNITDAKEIGNLIIYGEKRLVQAEHYGIPYERPEYLPPKTAYNVVTAQKKYSKLNRTRKE